MAKKTLFWAFLVPVILVTDCNGCYVPGLCHPGEYWNYTLDSCIHCPRGRFMNKDMQQCVECLLCASPSETELELHHQERKEPCTPTSDTKFQCKSGFSETYDTHGRLECHRCHPSDEAWEKNCIRNTVAQTTTHIMPTYRETEDGTSGHLLNDTLEHTEPLDALVTEKTREANATSEMPVDNELSSGAVAGIALGVVGAVAFCIVVIAAIYWIFKRWHGGEGNNRVFECRYSQANKEDDGPIESV